MLGFLNDPLHEPESGCIARMEQRPQFIVRAAAARLPAQAALLLTGAAVIVCAVRAGRLAWKRRQFTWRNSARLIGWVPVIVSGSLVTLLLLTAKPSSDSIPPLALARVIETVVPLAGAIHAALIFSPEDEPALEVALAAPRPPGWILLERWALVMVAHGIPGLVAGLAAAGLSSEPLGLTMIRWLAPLCFLTGAAMCLTLTARQPVFSAGLILLVWFGLSWAGDGMLGRWPFLWPAQVYLQPDHDYYWLNRALLCAIGTGLTVVAAGIVNDVERMLLGRRALGWTRKEAP
jgi:hypothetical protein